ncbi:MAG: hypothetical protein M1823_008207, partial [Watsoniomyces obsoletus]
PLNGLASFGHDAAAKVEELSSPEPGDLIILQSRPNEPTSGGSTKIGNLRIDVHHAAIEQGLLPPLTGFQPVWVVAFPLFMRANDANIGHTGRSGLCSSHHPFTAPLRKTEEELSKFLTDPLNVTGDHFDLVINGVEVGGGSRRIHDARMQELRWLLEELRVSLFAQELRTPQP